MAYIYQIYNDINDKVYIGKTNFNINKRFEQHCRDAFKRETEKRPLYAAMKKYGTEHFFIRLIEETDNPEEREKFWIEQKRSFQYGYNATKGGDGKPYLDYQKLIDTYNKLQSLSDTAKECNCDAGYLSKILKQHGVKVLTFQEVEIRKLGHKINQFDLNHNYINTFFSAREASRSLGKGHSGTSHIMAVCRGTRKTAYGYIWEFADEQENLT